MQIVKLGRLLDGVVYTGILLFIGGIGLFLVGELYKMAINQQAKKASVAMNLFHKAFPFPDKKYEFNLTHVVLFSLLAAMLSMFHHPAQDTIEQAHQKAEKKAAKKEAAKELDKKEKKAKAARGED
mmetsp:Transcript_61087/g.176014  ORF Transcript_61087/g.176014 Transcript_61087/m.176014 type:complete len:126 (+) Transcript_61087:69-446(+)